MIKLTCIGRIGKDAELSTLQSGKSVINFSLAHSEKYNGNERTVWLECAYFSDKTGILPYLKKGGQIYIEGEPSLRTWESNTGEQGASLTVRVTNIQLLGSKQEGQQNGNYTPAATSNATAYNDTPVAEPLEDLPF